MFIAASCKNESNINSLSRTNENLFWFVGQNIANSDHLPMYISKATHFIKQKKPKTRWNIKKAEWKTLKSEVAQTLYETSELEDEIKTKLDSCAYLSNSISSD